jgi:alpha,alpha-trehalase
MNNLNYGVIGNCKSAALVSNTGSIEWLCLPDFDSASVFAKILDTERGGEFSFMTDKKYQVSQKYELNTNILITRFQKGNNIFEVLDFMPRYKTELGSYYSPPDLIRYVRHVSGIPYLRVKYDPKVSYAQNPTTNISDDEFIKSYNINGSYESVYLYSSIDYKKILSSSEIKLQGDAFFLLSYNQKLLLPTTERAYLLYARTKVYWLNWDEKTMSFNKYNDIIRRSALVLKLLTYQKSGAILAAVTTSLPESIGEVRNWDYRFCWIRDASMIINILTKLGHFKAAKRYLNFIINVIPNKDEKIQIMYGIRGEKKLTERILPHLNGYEDSRPVRIGNDAYKQKQNDIYGVLVDIIYDHFKIYETSLENSEEFWTITRNVVRMVKNNWRIPDKGIWELRSQKKHFTFSKVLCWVALDRGVKIAQLLKKTNYETSWIKLRDKIKDNILENAWNEKVQAFTQAYNSDDLDASNLLMINYGFIDPKDPRFISTVHAIRKDLSKNGLLYRYKNDDDFGEPTSSFTICTFWMINALYHIGEVDEARDMFDKVLSYGNHLGLFSEDIDFDSKRLLGNFPQGYSHLALIEAAIALSGGTTKEAKVLDALQ